MTRPSPSVKIGMVTALAVAAVLAAVVAAAHELFSGGHPTASSALKRGRLKIRGNLSRPLAPGVSVPLNLKLTNPYRFDVAITKLTVAVGVDRRHAAAGCRASSNYKVKGLARRAYPLRLRARRTRTLRQLRVRRLPRVTMPNLPTNQDACKGAQLKLRYAGRARQWRRGRAR